MAELTVEQVFGDRSRQPRRDRRRAHARDRARRDRQHDRRDRGAADRRRPRRLLAFPVDLLDLPAHAGGHRADLRQLSDVFGRKPVLLFGVAGFLVGSVLCAVAWSMVTLIIFRGVQGLAAGAILPTTRRSSATSTPPPSAGRCRARSRQRVGRLRDRRPDARRLLRRVLVVARHLLRQHAARRRRRVADPASPARARRAAPHRIDYAGARADARPARC